METDIAQYDTTSNGGGVIIFRPFWFPWWPIGGQDASQIFDVRNFLRILYHYICDICQCISRRFAIYEIGEIAGVIYCFV